MKYVFAVADDSQMYVFNLRLAEAQRIADAIPGCRVVCHPMPTPGVKPTNQLGENRVTKAQLADLAALGVLVGKDGICQIA